MDWIIWDLETAFTIFDLVNAAALTEKLFMIKSAHDFPDIHLFGNVFVLKASKKQS